MKKLVLCIVVVRSLLYMVDNFNDNTYLAYKQPSSFINYTVKKGDCLSIIAEKYKPNFTNIINFESELEYYNNKANEVVNIGEIIKIPIYK